jgi:hypothetical protein
MPLSWVAVGRVPGTWTCPPVSWRGESLRLADLIWRHVALLCRVILPFRLPTPQTWTPSNDLDPIEQVFAKLKPPLRRAKERTIDDLWDRIGKLLGKFSMVNAQTTSPTQDTLQHHRKPL